MRQSAKKDYSQTRPMPCRFCGKAIRVDMYRHVARLHLDLVQLWRCPIAWCTTWKGSPQDCLSGVVMMLHGSRKRPASRSTLLRGLSVGSYGRTRYNFHWLLFSEVGMALTQHYRVYKGGLPHAVFRTDYMNRLRRLLRSPGQSGSPPEAGCASTPTSVR